MNALSKAQIIALFLGTASAETVLGVINGGSSTDTVPSGQTLITASSGTACSSNADCTAEGEKCANAQVVGSDATNLCIAGNYCGSLGRVDGVNFSLQCWVTPEEGSATAPAAVDPDTLLSQLEGLITSNDVNWDGIQNLFVSSRFNYQDGWWIKDVDDLWVENDKPADNRCFIDAQCDLGAGECCALYPDSNNRRCMASSNNKKTITVGPVSFIPTCPSIQLEDIVPENAEDDIAAGALAEASEAVSSFRANQLADAKAAADYDNLSDEDKLAFDEAQAANATVRDEYVDQLKTIIGYNTGACDDNCKALFENELNTWEKAKYEACKADAKSVECQNANDLKLEEENQRANGGEKNFYFDMTEGERTTYTNEREDAIEKQKTALVAAGIKESRPDTGVGRVCGPPSRNGVLSSRTAISVVNSLFAADDSVDCAGADECCGIATPVTASGTAIVVKDRLVMCNAKTAGTTYDDSFGQSYSFECQNAIKLASSVAAMAVAALYM